MDLEMTMIRKKELILPDPESSKDRNISIQNLLTNLASQEGCDGEPYDYMVIAAHYIDYLEEFLYQSENQVRLGYDLNKINDIFMELKGLVDIIKKHGILSSQYHEKEG